MIAAVFDCMVFLQAATSDRGAAFACLEFVEVGEVALSISPTILAEIRDVLTRPAIRKRLPSLTDERIELFLQKIATVATVVADAPGAANYLLRDPDDLPYLDLAIAVDARYLVSRDKDLLDLMNDAGFVGRFPQLQIVEPASFLNAVRAMRRE